MKKILTLLVGVLCFAVAASAQPRAFGARLGYGAEISYQYGLGNNFAEMDLGLVGNKGWYVSGLYDFSLGNAGIFHFYAGPGVQLGTKNYADTDGGNILKFDAAILGQIGAEVELEAVPLNISLDWRPAFSLTGGGFYGVGVGLGVRYRF